jgi:CRP/FNR family transcriptional regulator, cyclic AMP receptor protein
VKNLFTRLRTRRAATTQEDVTDSVLATSMFPADDTAAVVPWPDRAAELKAETLDPRETAERLAQLWRVDPALAAFGPVAADRLAPLLKGAQLRPDQLVIRQDEISDFLLVLLEGRVSVERSHAGGSVTRLMEARAGDLLGEMALFDGGARFSSCRTLSSCSVAVLDAAALERLLADDPPLAAALLMSITRRISLRLRQTGARLFALLAPQ